MKKHILLLFVLVSTISLAQHDEPYVDSLVSEFTQSLKERNINTFFVTERYCLGKTRMFTLENGRMCTSQGTYFEVYVFWQEEGKSMIKKIDNCGLLSSLELDNDEIFTFVKSHTKDLKQNTVKKYKMTDMENRPTQQTEIHSCYRKFDFTTPNDSFGQEYNLFALTNDSRDENLNADYNNSLKIVALDKMLDKAISENENKFFRLK